MPNQQNQFPQSPKQKEAGASRAATEKQSPGRPNQAAKEKQEQRFRSEETE